MSTAQVLTENDGDDGDDIGGGAQPLIPAVDPQLRGTGNSLDALNARLPTTRSLPEQDFEVIETDDAGNPLPGYESGGGVTESRLDEDHGGDGTLLDTRNRAREARSRKERRDAQKQGRNRTYEENAALRRELAALRERVEGIEPRLGEIDQGRVLAEVGNLDRAIDDNAQKAAAAKSAMAEAIQNGDGQSHIAALDAYTQATMTRQQLIVRKNMLTTGNPLGDRGDPSTQDPRRSQQAQQRQAQQPQAPGLSRDAQANVDDFQRRHPWLSAEPRNPDVAVMTALDNYVANQGFRPETQEYWDELEDLARERLPHRFAADNQNGRQPASRQNGNGAPGAQRQVQQPAPQRRGPMVASGGNQQAPQVRAGQVFIGPQRKQAMEDAGVIDRSGQVLNPTRYKRLISQYAAYDRDNAAGARQ